MAAVIKIPASPAQPLTNGAQDFAPRPYRFSVKEYDLMLDAGIFNENDRVELINGVVLEMSPKNAPHSSGVYRAEKVFTKALGERAVIRVQDVVVLNDDSEPEPDLAMLRPPASQYDYRQPTAADVLLILEVSDTTLRFDREAKSLTYAAAGVPQYLIFNVNAWEIEDYREPDANGYRAKQTYTAGQWFTLAAFPDVAISVSDLLPASPPA